MQGVDWTLLKSLLRRDKRHEINQLQNISNENHLRAVVECWLGGGHAAHRESSWRRLIWTLDIQDQTRVADKIRHFAESVLGKSCDSPSVYPHSFAV